jgi:hypothetical protein
MTKTRELSTLTRRRAYCRGCVSKFFASTAACALVLFALAARADGPGWVLNRTVVNIVNTANGGFNVRLSPDLTGCTSQSGYSQHYASVYPSHPGLNRIKADLVTALVTGKQVSLYLSDNTCTVWETVLGTY